jgi:hypothetical protein
MDFRPYAIDLYRARQGARSSVVELWFYTPAVGGSIPSAPTHHSGGAKNSNALPSGSRKLTPDP